MPKSKIFWFDDAVKGIAKELSAWMRHRDRNAFDICLVLGFSSTTWFHRMKKPKNFTLEEVWKAINYLKIPPEEAVKILTAGVESLNK